MFAQEAVNGPGHFLRLAALRADDDACVIRGDPVQADEVPPIVGEQDSFFSRGEGQHGVVGGSLVSETARDDAIEIVAESCQRAADFGVEVFVREKLRHRSGGCVVGDGAVDFLPMRGVVAAGGVEMFLMQRRAGAELARVVPACGPCVHDDPDGNAGAGKAGVTAADAGGADDERILRRGIEDDDLHFDGSAARVRVFGVVPAKAIVFERGAVGVRHGDIYPSCARTRKWIVRRSRRIGILIRLPWCFPLRGLSLRRSRVTCADESRHA